MIQTKPFEQYAEEYDAWYEQHQAVYESELLAIRDQLLQLPENIQGIEVGLGTGRFAAPLGIREGVEPAENMRSKAVQRGIEVMNARAERLPYRDMHFDFVLFVTICHLQDFQAALQEAHRVLKPGGSILVGFLPATGQVAKDYIAEKEFSRFYRHANFHTTEKVTEWLQQAGFRDFHYLQTLFGKLEDIQLVQSPREGYGEGSFVVIRAARK